MTTDPEVTVEPTLTDRQLAWVRTELGAQPDDAALHLSYASLGSVRDVVIAVLRRRRADLLSGPLSVAVSGVVTVNRAENVKAIERRLATLALLDADPSDDTVPGPEDPGASRPEEFQTFTLTRTRGR